MSEWRPDLRDALALGGLGLVLAGVAMIYVPASVIVGGLALLRLGKVI